MLIIMAGIPGEHPGFLCAEELAKALENAIKGLSPLPSDSG